MALGGRNGRGSQDSAKGLVVVTLVCLIDVKESVQEMVIGA